jgi:hypothetical protein
MAYGSDITEGLPYNLSNPANAVGYAGSSESYDVALNALPFFLFTNDEAPYRRQTAQYRKQQIDQSTEPGEQSITGWWVRAQSSFHGGDGLNFYDPSAGETSAYRFADSKGLNVWDKGEVRLLKSCTQGHQTTGPIATTGRPQQFARSITWTGNNGILLHDEYDVDKIDENGVVVHFIDYNAGAGVYPVYGICDDGTTAYWVTNITTGGAAKLTVFKKPLTGSSSNTADETKMFDVTGTTVSNAIMEFAKERIIACFDNKVYEFTGSATSLPSPLYTHPSSAHNYTSITASGSAIYIAGYNGIQSTIQKFTLSTAGALPTLTSAVVAAEMPVGEIVYKIYYYLGYMMIGTNKGIRAAVVSDTDGSISYGPLIVETSQPCYDFAARDRFVWCATGVDGEPGLIRIDLGNEIENLRFAYANDVYYPGVSGKSTTACAFNGSTNRISFVTTYSSATNGYVYTENTSTLMTTGYITTGKIRYNTLENKIFKTLKFIGENAYGTVSINTIDKSDNQYTIGTFPEGIDIQETSVAYPSGSQQYVSLKFVLNRSDTVNTQGPVFKGYQLKSLPAVPRQRLIQYPLACFDRELDSFGVQVGHEGAAYEKLKSLEDIESAGDTIRIEDFRNDESYLGLIEEIQFINRTPTDKRFSGFGGILLVTIRTL